MNDDLIRYENPLRPIVSFPNSLYNGVNRLWTNWRVAFPETINRYIDPFLGDGSMYFHIAVEDKLVNDESYFVIPFYEFIRDRNEAFMEYITCFGSIWDLFEDFVKQDVLYAYKMDNLAGFAEKVYFYKDEINTIIHNMNGFSIDDVLDEMVESVVTYIRRVRSVDIANPDITDQDRLQLIEGAFKSAIYDFIRDIYNSEKFSTLKVACWFFLKEYANKGVERVDKDGKWTTPYSGIIVNQIHPNRYVDSWFSEDTRRHLQKTKFETMEAIDFLVSVQPKKNDFIFVNLPRMKHSSPYARGTYTKYEHQSLSAYLIDDIGVGPHRSANWFVIGEYSEHVRLCYQFQGPHVDVAYFSNQFKSWSRNPERKTEYIVVKNY